MTSALEGQGVTVGEQAGVAPARFSTSHQLRKSLKRLVTKSPVVSGLHAKLVATAVSRISSAGVMVAIEVTVVSRPQLVVSHVQVVHEPVIVVVSCAVSVHAT